MTVWGWIVIAVVVVAAIVIVVWAVSRRRTETLRGRFGPEYERTVGQEGRRAGESELADRMKRYDDLDVHPLAPASAQRYLDEWREVQARFVDAPGEALFHADALITRVMRERGYPMDDFDQRAADLSVDHGDVVENYRTAHAISLANDQGRATTEDLRRAMVHYRTLFERLVEVDDRSQGVA